MESGCHETFCGFFVGPCRITDGLGISSCIRAGSCADELSALEFSNRGRRSMRALVTGITGQDGSYLAEFLLEKGYEVYGIVRRTSLEKYDRVERIAEQIKFVEGDLTDQSSLDQGLDQIQPDELYNLAAQSFVPVSWNQPVLTADVTGLGALRVLEAIRRNSPK